jgi:hypothetical protein
MLALEKNRHLLEEMTERLKALKLLKIAYCTGMGCIATLLVPAVASVTVSPQPPPGLSRRGGQGIVERASIGIAK